LRLWFDLTGYKISEKKILREGGFCMSEKSEIVFMQVRLLRIASEKWHTTIQKASKIFEKYGILKFIEDCYGIFHTEGDEAVFDEICVVLEHKGVDINAEIM
jgi:hypothetical protein